MSLSSIRRRLHRRLSGERGFLLVELLIAMTFLAVGVGALVAIYASTQLSLRHTSIEGNALTVIDKQMETFKTISYDSIKLSASTIPSSSNVYVTSPPSSLTSTQRAGITSSQVTGGSYSATQTVTGPDGRTYRLDTYMFSATPTNGRAVIQVTVAARLVTSGVAGEIRAETTSAFDTAGTKAI